MTTNLGPWRNEHFDDLGWHDVHVHGFRFSKFIEDEGAADLVLDIDYILKREQVANVPVFTVCPAELTFHSVFGLRVELDYKTPTAGMCPFSIDGITREPVGAGSFIWRIPINWPQGSLEFEAPAFTLALTGTPVSRAGQFLHPSERGAA